MISGELPTSVFAETLENNVAKVGAAVMAGAAMYALPDSNLVSAVTAGDAAGKSAEIVVDRLAKESGLYMFYKSDTSIEGQARTGNIEELFNGVKAYVEERHSIMLEDMMADGLVQDGTEVAAEDMPPVYLADYLENVSLLSAVDVDEEDASNKISLMTVHASKGLEFPYVYVVGMEENIFPSGGWLASDSEIEEERRLFYVAMTRAKKTLSLGFAQTRMRNGKHESNSPSRFVREIDVRYIENPILKDEESSGDTASQAVWRKPSAFRSGYQYGQSSKPQIERRTPSVLKPVQRPEGPKVVSRSQNVPKRTPDADFVPTPIMQLKTGMRIEHSRFGFGVIKEMSGGVADLKAKIAFDEYGEKTLMLNYAKIRAVNVD